MEGTKVINSINRTFFPDKPIGKLIHNKEKYYYFDTGTNKLFSCTRDDFRILEELFGGVTFENTLSKLSYIYSFDSILKTFHRIHKAIAEQQILKLKPNNKFRIANERTDIGDLLDGHINSITLEITQHCNLACRYCINSNYYSTRNDMSEDMIYRSIDFLKDHSGNANEVYVGFYGGEPLLKFDLIKRAVYYAQNNLSKKMNFNLTTNATKITDETARFLIDQDFSIIVSLDGSKEIHDSNRIYKNEKGSYLETVRGLEKLLSYSKNKKRGTISTNSVYSPPFSRDKIEAIRHELDIRGITRSMISYEMQETLSRFYSRDCMKEDLGLLDWALMNSNKEIKRNDDLIRSIFERQIARFFQRPLYLKPVCVLMNGCCIPGFRKNYISTSGKIRVCEKISYNSPTIGDIMTGYDLDSIKRNYINNFIQSGTDMCSKCWLCNLCDLCFASVFDDSGAINLSKWQSNCKEKAESCERIIRYSLDCFRTKSNRQYLRSIKFS